MFCFIIFGFLSFIVETCTTLRLNCSSFDVANVLQCKVLDFVSNFLLVVVAVVVVAMWNAFGVAEKGREAVKEEGGGWGRRGAAYEVDDDRDDGPLTLVSCATESPVAVFLPRSSSHYGILTQPTLSPYTCSSFSPSLPPSFSLLLSIILSVCRHILQMRSSSVAAL